MTGRELARVKAIGNAFVPQIGVLVARQLLDGSRPEVTA
jgi:hypothetical protein